MPITHVGHQYPKPTTSATSGSTEKQDDAPKKPVARSWEAKELKRKVVNGQTVPYWQKIPDRFERAALSKVESAATNKTDIPPAPPSTPVSQSERQLSTTPASQSTDKRLKPTQRFFKWAHDRIAQRLHHKSTKAD